MNKPLVIYHANCADGFGAAFAAWLKLGDEAEYLPMGYSDKLDPSKVQYEDREVYILDFSFPRNIMDNLFATAKRVVWLDHHKSAFEMWCHGELTRHIESLGDKGQHKVTLDNNKSGAMLAWEYFHPSTEVPTLVKHIDDYDRWQFKLDGTKAFNKALWSYAPWSFEQWREINTFNLEEMPGFYEIGEALLRAHDQNVQSVVEKSARECQIQLPLDAGNEGKLPGLVANCPPFLTSDVGHEMANQSGTFGLCWTLSKEGLTAKCSLRSNGEYDVSAIAKAFGGGGHRNASGFEVPVEVLLSWLK